MNSVCAPSSGKASRANYLWYEQSLSYNGYVIHAVRPLLELAGLLGRGDVLRTEAAIVQNLAIAPFLMRFPDGAFPNPSNAGAPGRAAGVIETRLAELYRVAPTAPGLARALRSSTRTWDALLDPPAAVAAEYAGAANLGADFPPVVSRSMETTRFALLKDGPWQVFFHYGQLCYWHAQNEALNWSASFDGIMITHDTGTSSYGSRMHGEYYGRGLGHNVPLIDGEGQKTPHIDGERHPGWARPGALLAFDSAPGRASVSAEQPDYRPGAAARRTLRIDGDTLIDEATVTTQSAARLGLALHVQGAAQPIPGFAAVADKAFTNGRPAAFGHWKDVRSATFENQAEFPVTVVGGKTFVVRIATPGRFTVYHGSSPDTPPPARRVGFYVEQERPSTKATFVTTLVPQPRGR